MVLRANWENKCGPMTRFFPVCLCILENLVGGTTSPSPPGYHSFYPHPLPGQVHCGGTASFVHHDIPFSRLNLSPFFEVVDIHFLFHPHYPFCSLYPPASVTVERVDIRSLVADLPASFLLLNDLNGRHLLWGGCTTNHCGVFLASQRN